MKLGKKSALLKAIKGYGWGALFTVFAFLIRLAVDPVLQNSFPYTTFLLSTIAALAIAGSGAALLSAVLGWLLARLFFMEPYYSLELSGSAQWLAFVIYVTVTAGLFFLSKQKFKLANAKTAAIDAYKEKLDLADAMPQMVWIASPDGKAEHFNKRWYEYTGSNLEESRGEKWANFSHPADRKEVLKRWAGAIGGGEFFEVRCRLRRASDGVYRWQLIRALPVRDSAGHPRRWFGTCTDIHDQIKNEEALQKSRKNLRQSKEAAERNLAQLQAVIQNMAEGVVIADQSGRFLKTNHAFLKMHGFNGRMRMLGTLREYFSLVEQYQLDGRKLEPEDSPLSLAIKGIRVNAQELCVRHIDGSEKSFIGEFYAAPVYNDEGRISRAIMTVRDISDRKQIEDNLKRIAYERENLLEAERAARSEAERANRLKDEFLATVSHELRTPLNSILGWAQLLAKKRADPEKAAPLLEQSARAQALLIEELLDMSRVISGKLQILAEMVDLDSIVWKAVNNIKPAADEKQIRLEVESRDDLCCVKGDPGRLQQVFTNLLSNAVKFSERGGKITVKATREQHIGRFEIMDTGRGIEPRFMPYLFEPFRQADASVTRKFGGLGLGLAIAKRLTQLHGGQIRVESGGLGQGAKFIVEFPMEFPQGEKAVAAEERNTFHQVPPGTEILIVEDDQSTRELLIHLLSENGAQVLAAESGQEALSILEHEHPDLLISDIGMPEMDGYSLMQKIREYEDSRRKIPSIALTAFAREEDKMKARESGFTHHLAKPLDTDGLLRLVSLLVEKHQGKEGIASGLTM